MCGGIPLLGSCWTFSIFVLSTGDQSQGFLHMRGVLYRWAPSTPQQVGYIAYLTPNRSPTTARTVLRFSAYLGGRTASTSQLLLGERWGCSQCGSFLVRETKLSKPSGLQDLPLFQLRVPVPPLALLISVQTVFSFSPALCTIFSTWKLCVKNHENKTVPKYDTTWKQVPKWRHIPKAELSCRRYPASGAGRWASVLQTMNWKEEAWAVMKPRQLSTPPEATDRKMQGCQFSSWMFAS